MKQIESEHVLSQDLVTIDQIYLEDSPNRNSPNWRRTGDEDDESDESFSASRISEEVK